MTDAMRRVLSLAGADPRAARSGGVRWDGRGPRDDPGRGARDATSARAAGAPCLSALGLLTADHVVDESRGYVTPWPRPTSKSYAGSADELESLGTRPNSPGPGCPPIGSRSSGRC